MKPSFAWTVVPGYAQINHNRNVPLPILETCPQIDQDDFNLETASFSTPIQAYAPDFYLRASPNRNTSSNKQQVTVDHRQEGTHIETSPKSPTLKERTQAETRSKDSTAAVKKEELTFKKRLVKLFTCRKHCCPDSSKSVPSENSSNQETLVDAPKANKNQELHETCLAKLKKKLKKKRFRPFLCNLLRSKSKKRRDEAARREVFRLEREARENKAVQEIMAQIRQREKFALEMWEEQQSREEMERRYYAIKYGLCEKQL
ncbi:MAG: hypothetical protein EXX96DRAFT_537059 [Benjaminiella poitrasii]|nr:MAG: hypothetical protein EXX96DRAFT_537059 [Benjaminiella poitrasii]